MIKFIGILILVLTTTFQTKIGPEITILQFFTCVPFYMAGTHLIYKKEINENIA